jgi:hypothetical protein
MIWFRRGLFLAIALVATAIAFQFWGKFSGAMHDAMQKSAAGAPASNEVTVGIVPLTPSENKSACGKKHPCPR